MCMSIAHNTLMSNIISLNKLTQAIVSTLKHSPINGYMCGSPIMLQGSLYKVTCVRTYKAPGLQQLLESLGVTPLTQLYHQACEMRATCVATEESERNENQPAALALQIISYHFCFWGRQDHGCQKPFTLRCVRELHKSM